MEIEKREINRKCCACNVLKSRDELLRITVHSQTKEVRVNPDSKFCGRSAYLCYNLKCRDSAFKKNRIFKLLKIKPDDTLAEKIRTVLEE